MRYLLDTDVLLRYVEGDKKLKASIKQVLQDKNTQVFISVISGIEISIKNRLGKLSLKTSLNSIFETIEFDLLDINIKHVLEFNKLPMQKEHKDPFDRIIISQAKAENLTLITTDKKIWRYKLPLLKA